MRFRSASIVTKCLSILLAIALALTAKVASTQMSLAAFRGTVIDEQGAVQLDVAMTAHNMETNETWNVTTGRLGQYFLPNLPTGGSYELTAVLAQFTPDKRTGLVLRVGQEVTVDFVLRLKGPTAEVTVVAEGLALDTTKNTLGTIITKEQIDNLPTIERDFSSLALLSPGVTIGAGGNGFSLGFNGQPGFSNGFFVDGVTAEWQYYGKQSSTFVQDWIQEFQVMTNSYTAEFGTASGGIVNAITRRGTNEFHGRGYGFFQEGALDANPFAGNFDDNGNPQYLKEKPPTNQYRLGGFIGGPIVKDRLFFFAGYERLTKDSLAVLSISEYWRNQGIKTVLPALSRDNPFLIRVDADVNTRNRLTFRYDRTGREDTNQTQSGSGVVEEGRYTFRGPVWNIMGNWTSTLGNTKFNEFRAFFGSNKKPIICNKSGTGGFDDLREPPGTFSIQYYPGAVFGCPFFTGLEGEENVGIAENFSLVKGHHQFKFGAQGNQVRTILNATNGHDGYWVFPLDLAFDINNPSSYPFAFGGNTGNSRSETHLWNYYFYVQDNWQIGRKINLNLGLRYDLDLSVTAGNDYVNAKNRQIIQNHGGGPLLQKTNVDRDNLAPRVGIVWSPGNGQKTLVRGAAGIFYDQNHNNFNDISIQNTLLSDGFGVLNAYDPSINPLGSPEALRLFLAQSFPYFPDTSRTISTNEVIWRNDLNLKVPYTVQYSGGLTHDFGSGLSAQADVVHVHGIGNPLYIDDNVSFVSGEPVRVDPRFATIQTLKNWGWTRYNALLAQFQYLGSREHLSVAYTLSKTTSKVNSNIFGAGPGNPLDLSADVGPDDTDRRHNLVVNGYWRFPRNFQIAGIWTYRSAPPYSVFSIFRPDRPEPRNSRRGDSLDTADFRFSKTWKIKEHVALIAFWEMFNAFNTDNFIQYDGLMESPTFTRPTAAWEPRRQQFGFRIDF